jgi:hypothetical protein
MYRSARYDDMIKSCYTINAAFLLLIIYRFMTLAQITRCYESKYADG